MKKTDLFLIGGFLIVMAAINVALVLTHNLSWAPADGHSIDWKTLGTMVAAAITVAVMSQLYKDNPLFKVAEHLFVGTALGYGLLQIWYPVWVKEIIPGVRTPVHDHGWMKTLFHPLSVGSKYNLGVWTIFISAFLGLLLYSRLSRKYSWVSRVPFALMIGFGVGLAIPTEITANLLKQLEPMMADMFHNPATGQFSIQWNAIFVLIGVLSTLIYFFFSLEHKRAIGAVSRVGVWFLMVAFGASFGLAVMGRLSLLIGRVDFLFREWIPLIR